MLRGVQVRYCSKRPRLVPLTTMGDRQKRLEELTDSGEWWEVDEDGKKRVGIVPGHLPFVVRVDGHKFSTLCRNGRFTTPYDVRSASLCFMDSSPVSHCIAVPSAMKL